MTLPLNKYSNKRVSQITLMQCIQHSWPLTIKLEPFTLVEPPDNRLFTPQTSWCSSSKIKQFQITFLILLGEKKYKWKPAPKGRGEDKTKEWLLHLNLPHFFTLKHYVVADTLSIMIFYLNLLSLYNSTEIIPYFPPNFCFISSTWRNYYQDYINNLVAVFFG